jgi:hypothetical protein
LIQDERARLHWNSEKLEQEAQSSGAAVERFTVYSSQFAAKQTRAADSLIREQYLPWAIKAMKKIPTWTNSAVLRPTANWQWPRAVGLAENCEVQTVNPFQHFGNIDLCLGI